MSRREPLGGIIHTYQQYDPAKLPSPRQPPPDLISGAFEHLLTYGSLRELTDEELAQAVRLDPADFAGLGPSLESLRALLLERKRKILSTYETQRVQQQAAEQYRVRGERLRLPREFRQHFERAFREEQLRELEMIWYQVGGEKSGLGRQMMSLLAALGDKYQIDQLAGKYEFTGRTPLSLEQALEVKEELEEIDRLLKQLEEAAQTAQLAIIDLDALAEYAQPGDLDKLEELRRQIQERIRELAEQQGLERGSRGYQLSPQAFRLFQGKLLAAIYDQLAPSKTGRHQNVVVGEGAVELSATKPYEFGDSLASLDLATSFTQALLRTGPQLPVQLRMDDLVVHRTRNTPKCASVVVMDMSGSMRYGGLYVHVKRMALALDGLIRREYPGDYLQFIEMYSLARPCPFGEIAALLPKPVTIFDPRVRLRADLSRPDVSESRIPPHFTNIQHALQQSRRLLANQDTPNRQVILITDGLPTAHLEGSQLYLLYPPDRRTEEATLREGQACAREGITINLFLLPSWSQTREDVQFAYRLAERTRGRVFFTAGRDLDRYVVWDYLSRRRQLIT